MKEIKIDLAEPFEVTLTKLLSVRPTTDVPARSERADFPTRVKIKEVLRSLYEAAHGRQVATSIGLVAIAPPVAAWLKETPFYSETQAGFLSQVMARLEAGSSPRAVASPSAVWPERISNRTSSFSRPSRPILRASRDYAVSTATK